MGLHEFPSCAERIASPPNSTITRALVARAARPQDPWRHPAAHAHARVPVRMRPGMRRVTHAWPCRSIGCERAGLTAPGAREAVRAQVTSQLVPPHLHRDWAQCCHISALGLGSSAVKCAPGLGSVLPHLCAGTGLIRCHICTGLGSVLPHLHRDSAHRDSARDAVWVAVEDGADRKEAAGVSSQQVSLAVRGEFTVCARMCRMRARMCPTSASGFATSAPGLR